MTFQHVKNHFTIGQLSIARKKSITNYCKNSPVSQRKSGKTEIPREGASEYTKRPLGLRLLGPRVSVAAFAAACAAFTADCVLLGALFLLLFVLLLLLLLLLSAAFADAFWVADR